MLEAEEGKAPLVVEAERKCDDAESEEEVPS